MPTVLKSVLVQRPAADMFALDYSFTNAAMDTLLAPVFGHIMETLVDRFVARAEGP